MKKSPDVELNLEQLLKRAKELHPESCIDLYYDPDTHYFYIYEYNTLHYFLPLDASFIGRGMAKDVRYTLEIFISVAVNKLIKEVS